MTQINPNLNNYNQQGQIQNPRPIAQPMPRQGYSVPQQMPVRIPDYYYIPDNNQPQTFKEAMEENPMYSMGFKMFFGPMIEHPIISLGTWLGFGGLLDMYSSACSGEYDKSLLKKIANFGDRIEESKLIQNKPVQAILKGLGSAKDKGSNLVKDNTLIKAMRETPSMPEWSMVKATLFNQKQEVVQDLVKIFDTLKLDGEGCAGLSKLALSRNEKKIVKGLGNVPEEQAVNRILLKRLGKSEGEISKIVSQADGGIKLTKQAILKEMGLTLDDIKEIREDTVGNTIKKAMQASKNVAGRVKIGLGNFTILGPLTQPFKRTIGCDSIYNRLYSMDKGARTATGRFMSKFVQMVHRGLTFGQGKLGVLIFIAPALVEAGMNVAKADKSEKIGTGVGSLVNNISWVFTFPIALKMMHAFGGLQNTGLTKDEVQKIRDIRNNFNKDNKKGLYAKSEVYKEARKNAQTEIDKIIKNSKQPKRGIFSKVLGGIARFLTMDLGRFDGRNTGNFFTTQIAKLRNLPRNLLGVPMRFILFFALSIGVLDGALNKCVKAIFGNSYDSMREDEIKDDKKRQKKFLKSDLNKRLYETQRQKQYGTQTVQQIQPPKAVNPQQQNMALRGQDINSAAIPQVMSAEQFVQQQKAQKVDNYTYIPSQNNVIPQKQKTDKVDNYTYIPSQNSTIKTDKEKNQNQRSYIPSQAAANIQKTYDNSGMQSALDRADKAEQRALKVLAGNFEGM